MQYLRYYFLKNPIYMPELNLSKGPTNTFQKHLRHVLEKLH